MTTLAGPPTSAARPPRAEVLVAYSPGPGPVGEIGLAVGCRLTRCGLGVDLRPCPRVGSVQGYAAVVLGSVVRAGRWDRSALDFLHRHATALPDGRVWLFSWTAAGVPPGDAPRFEALPALGHWNGPTAFTGTMGPWDATGPRPRGDHPPGTGWDDVETWAQELAGELLGRAGGPAGAAQPAGGAGSPVCWPRPLALV